MTKQLVLGLRFVQPFKGKRAFWTYTTSFLWNVLWDEAEVRDCSAARKVVYIRGRCVVNTSIKAIDTAEEAIINTFKRPANETHGWRTVSNQQGLIIEWLQ